MTTNLGRAKKNLIISLVVVTIITLIASWFVYKDAMYLKNVKVIEVSYTLSNVTSEGVETSEKTVECIKYDSREMEYEEFQQLYIESRGFTPEYPEGGIEFNHTGCNLVKASSDIEQIRK